MPTARRPRPTAPDRADLVVKKADERPWLVENREAIDDYNARVVKHGVFGDGRRRF